MPIVAVMIAGQSAPGQITRAFSAARRTPVVRRPRRPLRPETDPLDETLAELTGRDSRKKYRIASPGGVASVYGADYEPDY